MPNETIYTALSSRKTHKGIGDVQSPTQLVNQDSDEINRILTAAGNAPFHFPCHPDHRKTGSPIEPWRAYVLDGQNCRALMTRLVESGDTTKVPNMLAACEYLIQVTWLPDPPQTSDGMDDALFDPSMRNMEHIAAASAFIQSVLLAGEASGFKTYWSSGGPLRSAQVFDWLEIPDNQILLGSIFLFSQTPEATEFKAGANTDNRSLPEGWCNWCGLS